MIADSRCHGAASPGSSLFQLIGKIKVDMVPYAHDAHLAEACQIVTDDVAYLPIRHGVSVAAMRKNLDSADPWDVPRFRLARFKGPTG